VGKKTPPFRAGGLFDWGVWGGRRGRARPSPGGDGDQNGGFLGPRACCRRGPQRERGVGRTPRGGSLGGAGGRGGQKGGLLLGPRPFAAGVGPTTVGPRLLWPEPGGLGAPGGGGGGFFFSPVVTGGAKKRTLAGPGRAGGALGPKRLAETGGGGGAFWACPGVGRFGGGRAGGHRRFLVWHGGAVFWGQKFFLSPGRGARPAPGGLLGRGGGARAPGGRAAPVGTGGVFFSRTEC